MKNLAELILTQMETDFGAIMSPPREPNEDEEDNEEDGFDDDFEDEEPDEMDLD